MLYYPIQIDDRVYDKTITDLDNLSISDEIIENTDLIALLEKLRIFIKIGQNADSPILNRLFDYYLIKRYFYNLMKYCRKATVEEKELIYCNFISCLEQISICKNNPKLIRDLADLLCKLYTITVTEGCVEYTYDIFTYDLVTVLSSGCTAPDVTIETSANPVVSSSPVNINTGVPSDFDTYLIRWNLLGLSISSVFYILRYRISPPSSPVNGDWFIGYVDGETAFGKDFTEQGAYLDPSWNFNINHKKEYLANYRKYLFRYINNEWYVDDIENVQYKDITYFFLFYQPSSGFQPSLILMGGINYIFDPLNTSSTPPLETVYLDNPAYNKGLYIKITYTNNTGNVDLIVDMVGSTMSISIGQTIEFYSNGVNWSLV